ncbi:MAG: glycosyltransferase family 4 protein [Candidatus Hydrogenedentes bacterium]|nr:glycosyltransferase family 4 protein [Candidatus Hydrogenedentota bacterium]
MRVLLNALQAGNKSGTGHYSAQLARWLPGMADDVEMKVLWPKDAPIPDGAPNPDRDFLLQDTRVLFKRLLLDHFGVRRMCDRLEADLVHFPASVGNQLGPDTMIVTIHDLSFMRHAAWFRQDRAMYYQATIGRSAKLARRIIADSHCAASDLKEKLGVPEERIDVIPLGVDEAFRPAPESVQAFVRERYRVPARFFLYVGTVEPRKNLERLIEAWSRIARDCPVDLVIAGRDGWKVGPIHAAAKKSPYAERIHFVGFVDRSDLPALYSAAEAFVWPSLWEGFGLPPLEAMACGVPVLTSNVSSLPEVVGGDALLIDPHDVRAIADGMSRLVNDLPYRDTLITGGLSRAAQFTWQRTAELTLESYRTAMQS